MTLASQGRSASALEGAVSGNGLLTIDGARLNGLDPRAFDIAIRATDSGQATDDAKLQQIVTAALANGAMVVGSAQIPLEIKDSRLRVSATTLEGDGARAVVSGGYDIVADQADLRISLTGTAAGSSSVRPEIQMFAVGSPDRLDRTVDVAALSSWLAVRAIDRETRRLDALERGEAPTAAAPAAMPPSAISAPTATPNAMPAPGIPAPLDRAPGPAHPTALPPMAAAPPAGAELPTSSAPDVPLPGRDLRRAPRAIAPRPAASPGSSPSIAGQQITPLPAPIEIRPAPGATRISRPRPSAPLVLTPPSMNLPRPN
jgi:large subunit ribosomal protein L24